jgi:uncharacterized protein with PIN domain
MGNRPCYLRLIGFDTLYSAEIGDAEMIAMSNQRIGLTRDLEPLEHKALARTYRLLSTDPKRQLKEVVHALSQEKDARSFTRCLSCNSLLKPVARWAIADRVPPRGIPTVSPIHAPGCGRTHWRDTHHQHLERFIRSQGLASLQA